jgi:nucleoid-associated protein YgaU
VFFKGSRYENVSTDSIATADGRMVQFKKVRFIGFVPAQVGHVVEQGERLDQIAQRVYQDPELFWKICDANLALWPDDLVAVTGRALRIPPSES